MPRTLSTPYPLVLYGFSPWVVWDCLTVRRTVWSGQCAETAHPPPDLKLKSRSQTYSEAQYFYLEKLGRREGADPLSAIVAELEGNAEVVTAQEADCRLQLVF